MYNVILKGAKNIRAVTMAAILLASGSVHAISYRIATVDPADWLSTATQPATGWNSNYYFDTTGWSDPTNLTTFPKNTAVTSQFANDVNLFWAPNSPTDGSGLPNVAYFRYLFNHPLPGGYGWEVTGKVQVDDDYSLYVNGVEVYRNEDGGNAQIVDSLHFIVGPAPSVFAIVAYDGGYGSPWDRSYQDLMLDLTLTPIRIAMPEPTSLALTMLGLAALGWRKRSAAI